MTTFKQNFIPSQFGKRPVHKQSKKDLTPTPPSHPLKGRFLFIQNNNRKFSPLEHNLFKQLQKSLLEKGTLDSKEHIILNLLWDIAGSEHKSARKKLKKLAPKINQPEKPKKVSSEKIDQNYLIDLLLL